MIKFLKFCVKNTETKATARVYYSLDNHINGKPCVCLYEKSYGRDLRKVFPNDFQNDSEIMTDYCEGDRVRFFEGHPLYEQARQFVEDLKASRAA